MKNTFLCLFLFLHSTYGSTQLDNRIIGGYPTEIFSIPYQVSVQGFFGHFCGGSIIHKYYIVTAAHCVAGTYILFLKIRAGSNLHNKGGIVKPICKVSIHENYKNLNFDYDIAILKLCTPLQFNLNILPVTLPKYNEVIRDNSTALASGWGVTTEHASALSPKLLTVSLMTVNQTLCQMQYGLITRRMLCASCSNNGSCDTCAGDSGGPLVVNNKLMGIVSWGRGCARKDYPGVYTRVSEFRSWIKTKTGI